jgi:DNA-binding transcriptional ArsR family regulator
MDQDMRIISTMEELKVISDPLRLQIIAVYREHGKPLTVKGCADILNEVPAKIHYHIKKLLSINILELDHVEVINGINAKFYRLIKKGLKLELEETNKDTMADSFKHISNVVISQLENFKIDFLNSANKAMDEKDKNLQDIGWLTNYTLYLTESEMDELKDLIFEKVSQFNKKDASKKKYIFISGLSRKD